MGQVMNYANLISSDDESVYKLLNTTKKKIEYEIFKIFKDIPYQSSVKINLDRNIWIGEIQIKHNRGNIYYTLKNQSLYQLRDEIISKLHQEVSVTDQKRSTEVFQLNNATEFENYQIYSNNRQEIDEVETKLPVKIIVVDDDPIVNMVLTHLLGNLKYEVLCFESPIVALEYLERNRVDIVVLDWHLPFMSGLDFIVEAEERHLANLNLINIIFCTSENIDLKNYEHFKNVKICDFWDKKSSLSTIVESIEKISLSLQR